MPRKPFKHYALKHPGGFIDIGTQAIGKRPELDQLIGDCLMSWAPVEAEMALTLGVLLKANNPGAIAVFQSLRRSSGQYAAIREAAQFAVDEPKQELLAAVLNLHKPIEGERNALAHGHFGIYTKMPDGILWMRAQDYVNFKVGLTLNDMRFDETQRERLYSTVYYYERKDLETICYQIRDLSLIWWEMTQCLQERSRSTKRSHSYERLTARETIRRELERLREEASRHSDELP